MRAGFGLFLAILLLDSVAAAQPACPPDSVTVTAAGDTITVRHDNAERNCCSPLAITVQTQGFVVDFIEGEPEPWCRCTCCFHMLYAASGFAPGHYWVRVWDEAQSVLFGEDEVDVVGGSGAITVGALDRGECTVSVGPQSWSAVRVLYR